MNPIPGQPIDEREETQRSAPRLEKFFRAMMKANASDLHLKGGTVPHIRVKSIICATQGPVLSNTEVSEMCDELLNEKQKAFLREHGSIDVAYELEDSDRFRINIFRQRGHVSLAVRRVTRNIPNFSDLHLPDVLGKIVEDNYTGLVLLSGQTGSGKSTTIAAMLQHINNTRPCHIVTIEDPIEYLYTQKKAIISQREIGIDVEDFEAGLKYLMRQDPDVVLIGEMRDRETFQAALQAAETGHLVFGTVHASTAPQTVGRILDLFPPEGRELIRQSLAFNLRAIVCQKILPSVREDFDRVPAVEVLLTNPSVKQMIFEGKELELGDLIRAHERDGMQSFTRSLLDLIEKDYVDPKVAYEAAPNVEELKMMLKGISAGRSGLIGGR